MQSVLVAVSKHGLSPVEILGSRELGGKVYDQLKQFYIDIDEVFGTPGENIKIIFGNAEDWAKFLENEPFDSSAYIYITIKVEGELR